MKINRVCLIVGIILITLSLSVFVNACGCAVPVPTGCGVSTGCGVCIPQTNTCGGCGVICDPPCVPNKLACGDEVDTCINGTFFEVNDTEDAYHWGCKKGDDYVCCSVKKPINGVCGTEINSCLSGELEDIEDSTTQFRWNCVGSHGGTTDNCSKDNPCGLDMAPYILNIPDQLISYQESIKIDLWDYVKDYDDFLYELNLVVNSWGTSVDCEITSNRFLECSVLGLGETRVRISAFDSCEKEGQKEFLIKVTNSPPRIYVPNKTVDCAEELVKFIDLRNHSADEEKSKLVFELVEQSNPDVIECEIEDEYFLSCVVNSCVNDSTTITISTEDVFGEVAQTTFVLRVKNASPVWKSISPTCINDSESKLFDLRNYASDKEDGTELEFDLNNSLSSGLVCSIEDDYFISCELSSNKFLTNELSVSANDSFGNTSNTSVFVSGNCTNDNNRGSISFTSKVYGVCLERCTTYAFPLLVKNESNKEVCFNFDSKSSPNKYIETSLSNKKFCLNNGESSEITLNLDSCTTKEGNYNVKVFDDELDLRLDFEFEVGTCNNFDGFRIDEYDGTICSGEKKEYSVLVKNSSLERKKIYLSADNSLMLPHFNKDYVILEGGESEYVSLKVNASYIKAGTTEVVSILGVGEDYHIKKILYFDVVDCSNVRKRTFTLSVPDVCFDVERGQRFESQFSIRRNSDGDDCSITKKDFFLNIYGANGELSYDKVSLKKGDSKTIFYSLNVPNTWAAGKNYVTINAVDGHEWNSFSESKDICLNVLPQSNSSFFVRTQLKDVIWCGSNIFEIEVVNNGDLDETYSLDYTELPTGVSVSFSEKNFVVKKGESKIIYVSVSTNTNARVGDNQKIQLKLNNGSTQQNAVMYFNIKEKTSFDNLQILSATSKVNMVAFDLVVRNNSQSDLTDVIVSIESLPDGVNYEEIIIPLIKSGEVFGVNGLISAGEDVNGEYTPVFVVAKGEFLNKKSFILNISDEQEGFFSGMFTGLFSFGSSSLFLNGLNFGGIIGLVLLAIILIVLVWLITLGVLIISKPVSKKEAWME